MIQNFLKNLILKLPDKSLNNNSMELVALMEVDSTILEIAVEKMVEYFLLNVRYVSK